MILAYLVCWGVLVEVSMQGKCLQNHNLFVVLHVVGRSFPSRCLVGRSRGSVSTFKDCSDKAFTDAPVRLKLLLTYTLYMYL